MIDEIIMDWGRLQVGGYVSHKLITPEDPNLLQYKKTNGPLWKRETTYSQSNRIYRVETGEQSHILVWTGKHLMRAGGLKEGKYELNATNWPLSIKLNKRILKSLLIQNKQ